MKRISLALGAGFLLATSVAMPASAQTIPPGSYQQSCSNVRVRGDNLTARCTAADGSVIRSTNSHNSCGSGDIANNNGRLTCNARTGYYNNGNYNNGYYNNGALPAGSYQQSCSNARMSGDTLMASCPGRGRNVTSSINARGCQGSDIANADGQLTCNGYGYNNNPYNNGYPPTGSYQQSCSNVRMNGDTLTASCPGRGRNTTSSIDARGCRGGDIANMDGQLTCNSYGYNPNNGYYNGGYYNGSYNGGLPPGSYLQSCQNARMNGSTLSATCPGNGTQLNTQLNVAACRGADIANINGRLTCQ